MKYKYSEEKNSQILCALLKKHNIKRIIVSPGATNVAFVATLQADSFFEMYSAPDERSAAYIACGMAEETGEPVVITCTAATSSRNYLSGLTEAYYRKIPVLAVTAIPPTGRIGQNFPQMIDRSVIQKDVAKYSVEIPVIHDSEEEWSATVKINEAILELNHNGKGPVHINLVAAFAGDRFNVEELPNVKAIYRIDENGNFPEIPNGHIAVFVGAHSKWSSDLEKSVELFCEHNNAVVICDHTSNYFGKYKVQMNLMASQENYWSEAKNIDLLIDIGNVSGSYLYLSPKSVWRVNQDGIIRDTFKKLEYIFAVDEYTFFEHYNSSVKNSSTKNIEYYNFCKQERTMLEQVIPELPFSNIWIASVLSSKLPQNAVLHLGILNSLRAWNYFEITQKICTYCNTGGFGIDGIVSSLIGASISHPENIYFGVLGDLAFFYDMNSLGNRHVGKNIRLLVINNGLGEEFKNYNHNAAIFGEDTNCFIAAAGHYGNQSNELVRHYATDLGYVYICASSKEEFLKNVLDFTKPDIGKSVIFEIFTKPEDESQALYLMNHLIKSQDNHRFGIKNTAKKVLGESGTRAVKRFIGR